jgi:hypothetical protein
MRLFIALGLQLFDFLLKLRLRRLAPGNLIFKLLLHAFYFVFKRLDLPVFGG